MQFSGKIACNSTPLLVVRNDSSNIDFNERTLDFRDWGIILKFSLVVFKSDGEFQDSPQQISE